jgi:hypothetical protein
VDEDLANDLWWKVQDGGCEDIKVHKDVLAAKLEPLKMGESTRNLLVRVCQT